MAASLENAPVLHLPARLSEVRRMHAWLERKLHGRGLSSDEIFAIELCLEEAITNVAIHSAQGRDDVTVEVELEFAGGTAIMTVTDNGRPFDPLTVEPRPVSRNLEEAEVGGRGIQLIRAFAQELRYDRCGDLNRFTMIAQLGGPQPAYS
jgi:anti-sigma regulatory factor (Ser/Thr protein kinase)